jgi:hypothetical protein
MQTTIYSVYNILVFQCHDIAGLVISAICYNELTGIHRKTGHRNDGSHSPWKILVLCIITLDLRH